MKIRDYHFLLVMTGLVSALSVVFSGSFVFMGEMMAASLMGGGLILLIRRAIIKTRERFEKKQAV